MDRYKNCLTLVMATAIIQDMDMVYLYCVYEQLYRRFQVNSSKPRQH